MGLFGTGDAHLEDGGEWIFGTHRWLGLSSLPEWQLALQGGLCSTEGIKSENEMSRQRRKASCQTSAFYYTHFAHIYYRIGNLGTDGFNGGRIPPFSVKWLPLKLFHLYCLIKEADGNNRHCGKSSANMQTTRWQNTNITAIYKSDMRWSNMLHLGGGEKSRFLC